MAIVFSYTETTNTVVVTGGTEGTPADFADFIHFDRTLATAACTIASGAELKAATAVAADTDLTLTYPMRPVEHKALRLAITTAQNGGAAVSGDETVDIFGTTCIWHVITGASASGQKVVPIVDLTHNYQVGDTVILIDISAPATYETDVIASIQEGVSITLTNNNTNSYAIGDIVGIYQTEQIDTHTPGFGTVWTTVHYGQIAMMTFTGYDGTNTAKVDQPIWGVIWDYGNGQYQVDCLVRWGDGGTTTWFTTKDEHISFTNNSTTYITTLTANCTFTSGQLDDAASRSTSHGSHFTFTGTSRYFWRGAALNATIHLRLYGTSMLSTHATEACLVQPYRATYYNCNFINTMPLERSSYFGSIYYNVTIQGSATRFQDIGGTIDKMFALGTRYGVFGTGGSTMVMSNLVTANVGSSHLRGQTLTADMTVIDLDTLGEAITVSWHPVAGTHDILLKYTVNIEVTDKDGTLLDGVIVLCEDQADVGIFSELTGATNTGKIDEQTVLRGYYDGPTKDTSLTDSSPHKFTLSKAGYETLILENVTVDGPIDWYLELQPATGPGVQKQWR